MASSSWMSDFSTLACEHYVNDFFIGVISFKLLEKSKPRSVIYFPSFSQMWAKQGVAYLKHKVTPFFDDCPAEHATCILMPVYFDSPLHWGLLCVDTRSKMVYSDDGLKIDPPNGTCLLFKTCWVDSRPCPTMPLPITGT